MLINNFHPSVMWGGYTDYTHHSNTYDQPYAEPNNGKCFFCLKSCKQFGIDKPNAIATYSANNNIKVKSLSKVVN